MAKGQFSTGVEEVTMMTDRKTEPEPEALMGVEEFGATSNVNRTLFAGFSQYCKSSKMPPRLTAKQWSKALTTWQHAPVTS